VSVRRKSLRSHTGRIGPVPPRLGRVVCLKWRLLGALAVLKVSVTSVRVGSETDGRLAVDGSIGLIVLREHECNWLSAREQSLSASRGVIAFVDMKPT
jgi:hypothetical protein